MPKMKRTFLLARLALGASLWMGCQPQASTPEKRPTSVASKLTPPKAVNTPVADTRNLKLPEDAVKGDFDGDGRSEYVWLVPPEVSEDMDCKDECNSYLRFSKATLPAIEQDNCIGGTPDNLGDLNEDGGDEIGLLPQRAMGCWVGYYVYTYRAGRWKPLVGPISTYCNEWENGLKPIEKDPAKKGYVLIRYTDSADTTFTLQTKSVPVQ